MSPDLKEGPKPKGCPWLVAVALVVTIATCSAGYLIGKVVF